MQHVVSLRMHRSWLERASFEPRDLHPSFNRQDLKPYVEHLNEKSGKRVSPLCVYTGPVLVVFIAALLIVLAGDHLFQSCKQVEDSSFNNFSPDDIFAPPAVTSHKSVAEVYTAANGRPTTVWVTATATTGAAATQAFTGTAPSLAPAAAAPAAASNTGAAVPVTPATSANPAAAANGNTSPASAQPAAAQPANPAPANPVAANPAPANANPAPANANPAPANANPAPANPTPPANPAPANPPKNAAPPDTGHWVTGQDNARGLPDTSRCPTDVWSADYQPCLDAVNWEWAERHGLHFTISHTRRLRRRAGVAHPQPQPQATSSSSLSVEGRTVAMAATSNAANAQTYHEECESHPLPRILLAFGLILVAASIAAIVERVDMSDARGAAQKAVDDLNKRSAGSRLRWSYGEDKKTIITTHIQNGYAYTSKRTRRYPVVQLYAMTPPPQVVVVQKQRSEGLFTEEERLNAGIARLASVASSAEHASIGQPARVASVGSSSSHVPSSSLGASYATSASGASSASLAPSAVIAPPAPLASPAPYAPPASYASPALVASSGMAASPALPADAELVLKVRPTEVPQPAWATQSGMNATPPAAITEPAPAARPVSEHDMAPPYSEVWENQHS
ncbi:hypothetical protein HDU87_000078 [Geranomyces variabilis]|uniref:Uncharacterized protein n=1 Tax=Geranomyces variabilis TaxID=109894 RepID=A0AAD5XU26_9FUNG|nr:hypothetical protein HDU87_000078 [Geranomyces variabilis]